MSKNFISQKGFSYAEAMVTMLIVAIIMVATTPIITKKANTHKGQIWSWSDGGTGASTFFGTGAPQRVIIGEESAGNESAKLIVYSAADNRIPENRQTLPPIVRFNTKIDNTNAIEEIGRITTTNTSLGIGKNALEDAQGGLIDNLRLTAIGAGALQKMWDGTNNTAIGYNACSQITTGSNNICIGAESGPNSSNVSNQLFIGKNLNGENQPLIHADFSSKTVTINGTLKLGSIQNVENEITTILRAGIGSDARLKNIKGNSQAGLKEINKLQIKNYTYKKDKEKIPHVGVIAQELQKVFPNAVTKDKDGYLRIRQEDMFYAMINAIKELDLKFNKSDEKTQELEQEISNLKEENAKLLQRLEALEQKIGE